MDKKEVTSEFIKNSAGIIKHLSSKAFDLSILSSDQELQNSKIIVKSIKAKASAKRTIFERFADFTTSVFGSFTFLVLNVVWFASWIVVNTSLVPGISPFDPFPFGLLTMIVSLEAIVLAILVLISQNRGAKIADLREEIDLQVNVTAEREITKVLALMMLLLEKNGIDLSEDANLKSMLKPFNTEKIEKTLEKEIS